MGGSNGYYAYSSFSRNVRQQNIKQELENNDTVTVNSQGYEGQVRARYFLSRMLENVIIDNSTTPNQVVFVFADMSRTIVPFPT